MMPVLVTTNRKGLSEDVRAEIAAHSISVGGRPTIVKRFEVLMWSSIVSGAVPDFRPSALTIEARLRKSFWSRPGTVCLVRQ